MRIFLDLGHPAHVHYFKNFVSEMTERGHTFLISARDKEMTHHLLEALGLAFFDRGRGSDSALGKLIYLARTNATLLGPARRFRPDVFLSFGSPYAAHVSSLLGKPHIAFDDTENAKFGQMFYRPFTNTVVSPDTFAPHFGDKHVKFPGYMELCHLHPNRFRPDPEIVSEAGIDPNAPYVVMRFVAWNANHDIGHSGLTDDSKLEAARKLGSRARLLITSEGPLPHDLEAFRASFPPSIIHHVLAFARLVYGESATMASEAAVLGTPAVYVDDVGRGYTTEQEQRFGMVSNFTESLDDQAASIDRAVEVLSDDPAVFASRRAKLLSAKIDVTDFMVWLVENYPQSVEVTRAEGFDRWMGPPVES